MTKLLNEKVISLTELWIDQESRIAHWMLRIASDRAGTTAYALTVPLHPHGLETDRTWDASGSDGVWGVVSSGTGEVSFSGTLPSPGFIVVRGQSTIQTPTTNPFAMTVTADLDLDGVVYSAFETFKLGNKNVGGLDRLNGWVNQEQLRQTFFEPIPAEDQPTLDLIENRLLRLATLSLLGGTGSGDSGYNPDNLTLKRTLGGIDYAHFVNMIKSAYDGDPRVVYQYERAKTLLGYDWEDDLPYNYTLMSAWQEWVPVLAQTATITHTDTATEWALELGRIEGRAHMTLTSDGTAGARPTIVLPSAGVVRAEVIGQWTRVGPDEDCGPIRKINGTTAQLWRANDNAWAATPLITGDVVDITLRYEAAP